MTDHPADVVTIPARITNLRDRMYGQYATTHAGIRAPTADDLVFRQEIRAHLPADRDIDVIDIGCGQGAIVRQLLDAGYHRARGVDISPEQVELARQAGLGHAVDVGDATSALRAARGVDAVIATDLFEHLTKPEVLAVWDAVHAGLREGGVLIARVPNAVSPFGGNYQHGDFTHETAFTARSARQVARTVGFTHVEILPCEPIVHGARSALRWAVWRALSGSLSVALAAETGVLRGHLFTQNILVVARRDGRRPNA
ncbi:class I SAM-dependent methyltransferase [Protofrankia coriariae]|uniref:Methyltransferase domain-containing protein n=1 Tax=Protofrankia coriariae TaxID=1562887 RepID=A0ABR5F5E0_9ACTN|nr:class I SAM-dependent methyltransferase [Protofrankia coriariae]KLL11939.1 hypothetical protein FrCorBMG51_07920 [Protofrankia coriariae]